MVAWELKKCVDRLELVANPTMGEEVNQLRIVLWLVWVFIFDLP